MHHWFSFVHVCRVCVRLCEQCIRKMIDLGSPPSDKVEKYKAMAQSGGAKKSKLQVALFIFFRL